MTEPGTAFVYRPGGMGDLLLTFPALRLLQESGRRLLLMTDSRWHSLTTLLPQPVRCLSPDDPCWSFLFGTDPVLPVPPEPFEEAWVFRNAAGAPPLPQLQRLSGVRVHRIATPEPFAVEPPGGLPVWRFFEEEVRSAAGLPSAPAEAFPRPFAVPAEPGSRKEVFLVPDTGSTQKSWKTRNWLELAEHLQAAGFSPVFLMAPEKDPQRIAPWPAIREERPGNFLPRLQQAAGLIAGDTGPAHLAALTGIPVLVLYGPTVPEVWGVPGPAAALGPFRPCAPCSAEKQRSCRMECIPCGAEEVSLRFRWLLQQL